MEDAIRKSPSNSTDRSDAWKVPPNIELAAEAAFRADFPDRNLGGTRLRAEEPGRYVIAVYSPVEGLKPTPYMIYEVARDSMASRRLTGDDGKPYLIKGYK
jgi:hypothetical protein